MNRFVYLDNNATTKISENIKQKIMPYIELQFGNPSSLYQHGVRVKKEIENARKNCADLINTKPENIMYTSGGSESNCSAYNSAVNQLKTRKKIVTTKVEHSSILEYCELLKNRGYEIQFLNVDSNCNLKIDELEKYIDNNTCLVSIQLANNEVGSIVFTDEVNKKIRDLKDKYKFLLHIDCVQGLGKTKIDVKKYNADFMSFSGHKVHCPKGIGFLYIKDTKKYIPLITGHQERGLRGGTENVIGIIALGESCKYIKENFEKTQKEIFETHEYLENQLKEIKGIVINCRDVQRIPNTTSITFDSINGNKLMFELESSGICVSTGSACNSESSEPSYVLTSMGIKNPQNTIRISVSEETNKSQIDYFINNLVNILQQTM